MTFSDNYGLEGNALQFQFIMLEIIFSYVYKIKSSTGKNNDEKPR